MQPESLNALITVLFITFALCAGSFAGVLVYRVPRGLDFVKGRSYCPVCGKTLKPLDLVPLVSFMFLRGKCGSCGARISFKYPLLELLSVLLAASALRYGFNSPALFTWWLAFYILMVIAFIDAEHMLIPNGLVIALALASVLCTAVSYGDGVTLLSRVAGFSILSVPMFLLTLIIKDAFGGGDIKLIAVCGFLLGLRLQLLAGFIAVLLGGTCGIYIRYISKDKRPHMAFGPCICAGTAISALFGESIIHWYLGFFP